MQPATDPTQQICLDWMSGEGKRWRPFLLSAVWQALTGKTEMTTDVHRAAVAVECFHKASLIHDDVEDQDATRYGQPTIHALYGDAFAINVGDALLGLGYRILAQSNNAELLRLIADAHVKLCRGQGEELMWNQSPINMDFVMNIFRYKTVPAFEVSLMLGLSCTGNFVHLRPMLKAYSDALGIAYQLKDDLEDFVQDNQLAHRPSAVLALQTEHPTWSQEEVKTELQRMTDLYHQQALDALNGMDELELKRLLYQVTEKILG
jgi:geranylgeranyl pyrophosphate synthase